MNNWLAISRELERAVRAGFDVQVTMKGTSFAVHVDRRIILAGQATDRVQPFTVVRQDLRDAAGNALQVTALEIGLDRETRARRVEALDAEHLADMREELLTRGQDERTEPFDSALAARKEVR